MDYVSNEFLYVKESEWKFFLSGLGFSEVYGLFSEEKEGENQEASLNEILTDLYRKELISCEGKKIIVLPPVSELLEIMQKSKKCVVLRWSGNEHPVRCCYVTSEEVLIMEKSQREKSTIRLMKMSVEEWTKELLAAMEEDEEMQIYLQDSRKNLLYEKIVCKEVGLQKYLFIEEEDVQTRMEYQSELLDEKIKKWIM